VTQELKREFYDVVRAEGMSPQEMLESLIKHHVNIHRIYFSGRDKGKHHLKEDNIDIPPILDVDDREDL